MTTTSKNSQNVKSHCPCTTEKCPLDSAMSVLGGKWKVQIICALYVDGPVRFNELKRRLSGVSNTVLTAALKDLEDKALVVRKQYMEVPPRVEYTVTEKCGDLMPLIKMIAQWGLKLPA